MLYGSFIELDGLLSLIMIIIYGLFSLKSTQIYLMDVFLLCRLFPLLFVFGFYMDLDIEGFSLSGFAGNVFSPSSGLSRICGETASFLTTDNLHSSPLGEAAITSSSFAHYAIPTQLTTFNVCMAIDVLLALLLFFVMYNFQSFESILLLLFAFIGQYYMLHSIDLLTFYLALEAQNFCFLVLCGLPTISYSQMSNNSSIFQQNIKEISKEIKGISKERKVINPASPATRFHGIVGSAGYEVELCQNGVLTEAPRNGAGLTSSAVIQRPLNMQAVLPKVTKLDKQGGYKGSASTLGSMPGNYVFSVEASIKYFLLSGFSSGVLLFWFSAIYLQTGMSILSFSPKEQGLYADYEMSTLSIFLILCAMIFKLGAAPLHFWVVQIYNGAKRNLLLYISTAPKLSLFGFWVNSFQTVWSDYSVILFSIFSIILGAFGAYNQPSLRGLLAFSTINEIGLLLSALETAGFNSLFQHLGIYIISQLLLWNLYDKRIFVILAVSLAGLPPLAGFFGKSWIFWHLGTVGLTSVLLVALFCTGVSLVYYLRIIRLFWNPSNNSIFNYDVINRSMSAKTLNTFKVDFNVAQLSVLGQGQRVYLTSACVILLFILPIFLIKPFII